MNGNLIVINNSVETKHIVFNSIKISNFLKKTKTEYYILLLLNKQKITITHICVIRLC